MLTVTKPEHFSELCVTLPIHAGSVINGIWVTTARTAVAVFNKETYIQNSLFSLQ
jgi:hypothetical protein